MCLEPEKNLVRNEVQVLPVELCGLYRPFGTVRIVKAWRLRWFGYEARMWKASNASRIFFRLTIWEMSYSKSENQIGR